MWSPPPFSHELAYPSLLNGDKGKMLVTYSLPHELAQPSVLNGDKGKILVSYSFSP